MKEIYEWDEYQDSDKAYDTVCFRVKHASSWMPDTFEGKVEKAIQEQDTNKNLTYLPYTLSNVSSRFPNLSEITEVEIVNSNSTEMMDIIKCHHKYQSGTFERYNAGCLDQIKVIWVADWPSIDNTFVTKESVRLKILFDGGYHGKLVVTDASARFFTNFYNARAIIGLSHLDFDKVTDASEMFKGLNKLKSINMRSLKLPNCTRAVDMFARCSSLEEIDTTHSCLDNLIFVDRMFHYCKSLKKVNLLGMQHSRIASAQSMFSGCASLTEVNAEVVDWSHMTNSAYMFSKAFDKDAENTILSMPTFNGCPSMTRMFDTNRLHILDIPQVRAEDLYHIKDFTCDNIVIHSLLLNTYKDKNKVIKFNRVPTIWIEDRESITNLSKHKMFSYVPFENDADHIRVMCRYMDITDKIKI